MSEYCMSNISPGVKYKHRVLGIFLGYMSNVIYKNSKHMISKNIKVALKNILSKSINMKLYNIKNVS